MLVMPLETMWQVHEQEWGQLIAQTAQGDQHALATLYDRTSPQVYGLVLKILDNREAAEEVTLDVYTQVWRQVHTYDETRGTPGSWLMTIARTRAIDRFRVGIAERGRIESLDAVEFFCERWRYAGGGSGWTTTPAVCAAGLGAAHGGAAGADRARLFFWIKSE